MKRIQVLFEERQHSGLLTLSRRTGRGLGALVREAVDRMLKDAAPKRRLSDICGVGRGDGWSATNHDEILYGTKL